MRRGAAAIVLVAAVGGPAALQGLLAAPGLGSVPDGLFALETIVAVVVLWIELVLVARAAHAIAGEPPARAPTTVPRAHEDQPRWGPLLAWSGAVVLVLLAVGMVLPYALPLVAVAALCVLPVAAPGRWDALAGFAAFRRPWPAIAATLVTVAASVLSAVVALLAGFFLGGLAGGVAMWLWFGTAGALLLLWWTRRSRPVPASVTEPAPPD